MAFWSQFLYSSSLSVVNMSMSCASDVLARKSRVSKAPEFNAFTALSTSRLAVLDTAFFFCFFSGSFGLLDSWVLIILSMRWVALGPPAAFSSASIMSNATSLFSSGASPPWMRLGSFEPRCWSSSACAFNLSRCSWASGARRFSSRRKSTP